MFIIDSYQGNQYITILKMVKGSAEERLQFAFNMIDIDGNGKITKSELKTILNSIYRVLNNMNIPTDLNPDEYAEKLFDVLDSDKDGEITFEEYKTGAVKNSALLKGYYNSRNIDPLVLDC
jgi:Ca2+-binding EF-hand superfamily protein